MAHRSSTSTARLRVAHVSPTYFADKSLIGGGERYVSYIALALQEVQGSLPFLLEQAVFAIGPTDRALCDRGGLPVTVLADQNPGSGAMEGMSVRLWQVLRDFDIVHVHQALTFFGCYCAVVARSLGKTLIMTDLGGGACSLLLEHGGLRLADGLLSISKFAGSLVGPYFPGPHAAIAGPVDTTTFTPPAVPRRRCEVLCVGRLLPHKGIDRVIDALPPGLPLRIVGRPYDAKYHALLVRRAARKQVTFVLDADDAELLACFHSAGIFVQASTFVDCYGHAVSKPELMGLTTLEALSTGLPVAIANAASLPELASDPRFSMVFDDDAGLRTILERFAAGLWPEPGASELARRHAVERYSFPVVGRQIAEFYARVHAERARS